ncbi:ATPase [Clostridium sp. Cult2]|uniref:ATPase n=1 Tax=Clostridium sp. Cult2 TaxID=2079003 RepID=UPI001F35F74C|nr:ATPase [Clostridium sp. Cult2]MCF6466416.1 ATPase [Clostridium sp. Cult2]
MDVLKLIDEIEDVLENASSLPFSNKVMVDAEELFEIIREVRIKLPDEIKQASWIKEERQRILAEAQKDADTILNEAEFKLEELVEEDEITKKAKERAEEIITKAQTNAKSIRLGALEYADNILLETQEDLKDIIDLLNKNRQELRGDK